NASLYQLSYDPANGGSRLASWPRRVKSFSPRTAARCLDALEPARPRRPRGGEARHAFAFDREPPLAARGDARCERADGRRPVREHERAADLRSRADVQFAGRDDGDVAGDVRRRTGQAEVDVAGPFDRAGEPV